MSHHDPHPSGHRRRRRHRRRHRGLHPLVVIAFSAAAVLALAAVLLPGWWRGTGTDTVETYTLNGLLDEIIEVHGGLENLRGITSLRSVVTYTEG